MSIYRLKRWIRSYWRMRLEGVPALPHSNANFHQKRQRREQKQQRHESRNYCDGFGMRIGDEGACIICI
jgi:hypothetical protein